MSGSNVIPINVTGTVDVAAYTPAAGSSGIGVLYGWSIRESAGVAAVATVVIRAGTSAAGQPIAEIELAANASSVAWFGPQGIQAKGGIYVDIVAGEIEGAVYIA